ncbi:MAG: tRNA (adenosine(37)-N6)-threonylcarbamoyltransferase complex dimerization subunit type 1 TsaB [bacterium]|nr:tRNA (adenosine(37)-N6)-threonylcarbamoyltransferase complex dimerization subunit type 1 TsaB [bacterium]
MIALGIETSTTAGSLALVSEEEVLASSFYSSLHLRHSSWIIGEIDHILNLSGIKLSETSVIAVSTGPGSFSGIRVGYATAHGLSAGLDIPVIGVLTSDVISYNIREKGMQVCSIIDGRKDKVHIALYREQRRVSEHITCNLSNLFPLIDQKTLFVGPGVPAYKDRIKERLADYAFFSPSFHNIPQATNVALLGLIALKRDKESSRLVYGYLD